MTKALALLLLVASFSLAACATKAPPAGAAGPVEAVQAFASAAARGDTEGAFSLLSLRTQREADEVASAARAKSGDAGPASGRQMLFTTALPQGKIEAREVSRQGDSAEVSVTDATGKSQSFHAVREGGVWRVDLALPGR